MEILKFILQLIYFSLYIGLVIIIPYMLYKRQINGKSGWKNIVMLIVSIPFSFVAVIAARENHK